MLNADCMRVPSFSDRSSQNLALWDDFNAWLTKHSENTEYSFRYRDHTVVMLHKGVQIAVAVKGQYIVFENDGFDVSRAPLEITILHIDDVEGKTLQQLHGYVADLIKQHGGEALIDFVGDWNSTAAYGGFVIKKGV